MNLIEWLPVGGMGGNQMVGMNMLQHMQNRVQGKADVVGSLLNSGYSRAPPPNQFLRQSPSPSAPSPSMGPGPSPASMGKIYIISHYIFLNMPKFPSRDWDPDWSKFKLFFFVLNMAVTDNKMMEWADDLLIATNDE